MTDFVNFNLSIPIFTYLQIERAAKIKKITKNELILQIIRGGMLRKYGGFEPK